MRITGEKQLENDMVELELEFDEGELEELEIIMEKFGITTLQELFETAISNTIGAEYHASS
jgi:Tol biopolymer transport system component